MFSLYDLFTDPITLTVLGLFALFALAEGLRPGRRQTRVSGWRLKNGRYGFPIEHKAFHAYVKLTKQTKADKLGKAAVAMAMANRPSGNWIRRSA